jgi:DNA-binding NarL/FixJ family response regulator
MPARARKKPIRLFIADGHTLFREGLRRLIDESYTDVVVVGEACNGREAVREVSRVRPDILVLDLVLSELNGMEVLRRIAPLGLQTLVLTSDTKEADTKRAVQLKASAILPKQSPFKELIRCIRLLGAGKTCISNVDTCPSTTPTEPAVPSTQQVRIHVTKRERDILGAIAAGCSNKEIGRRLLISDTTVKHYLQNIFNKTGTSNRIELLYFAIQNRLVDDTSGGSPAVESGPALGGAETA